jgi:hypothetical protein
MLCNPRKRSMLLGAYERFLKKRPFCFAGSFG